MKKRTRFSLRTKIYLAIVGLFALTGALYAATPIFFNAFPQATGVAISTSNMYATGWCDNNFYGLDCLGNRTVLASIPLGNSPCIEKYLAIAPVQSVAAGFTARDVFITEGQYIYKYDFSSGTISPAPFAQVGCPFSDHSSLTFDKVGTFGFKMIVACENGPIWTVDGTGNVDFVASTTTINPPLLTHPEGPAIAPLSFGPLGGQILVGDENLGQVTAIKNDGTVTYNAFNWPAGFEANPENVNVIPDPACGFGCIANQPQGSFFQAIEDYGFFLYYGPLDFAGLGGNVIVTNEAEPPATTAGTLLVKFNPVTNAYDTTTFDPIFNFTINEGAKFVECDAVTPTPTPTPTFTPTPTPTATFTPTPTATFTPTPTATFTPTPTATFTPTPTATFTPTPTATFTPTPTATFTPTPTATFTPTPTATFTPTPTPTPTPTGTVGLPCPAGNFLGGNTGGGAPGDISIAYDQFPAPNDSSYGVNSVGWHPGGHGGHSFSDLTDSDKAGFQILRPNGTIAVSFNVDYITASSVGSPPSGYKSLGPFGGDGSIVVNSTPALVNNGTQIQWDTSFARDLNGPTVWGPTPTWPTPTYFVGGVQTIGTSGTNSANLLTDSPPVNCSLATDPNCLTNYGMPKGIQYPLAVPNPWVKSYNNPEYSNAGGPIPLGPFDAGHVDGWNFHDTYFVTFKQTYLTAIGFDFSNFAIANFDPATNTFTCPSGKWCVAPNPTALHNSPAKACPSPTPSPTPTVAPTLVVTSKTLSKKNVKVDIKNNTAVNQVVTALSITWPQGPNGNLNSITFDGTTIYNTSTGGGSLTTSSLLGTTAQRTITPGETDTIQFTFQNNVDPMANHYTGSLTFNPFGPLTILP